MGSAPMIALSPSGCPPPRLPPTPHRHSCESRNPSPGTREMAPPRLPPLGTRVRGHDVVPPPFLRKQESIPGTRGMAPPHLPPLGTRVRGHDDAPPSFLRSLSSQRESIPAPPPPSGYPRPRARRGSTVFPAEAGIHPWGAGEWPRPTSPFWVPACAGTTTPHRHSCEA